MSRGRKTVLVLGAMYAFALGSVFALVQIGRTDDGDSNADETATTTAPPATPPPTGPPVEYRVRPGDTLTGIAQRFDVTAQAIIDENRLTDPDALREGETLQIPPPPPVWLEVAPTTTVAGREVDLTLTGAQPSETVTFEIRSPNGVYTGPPRTASEEGTVSTTYRPGIADEAGTYTIVATGDQGTSARATLRVESAES